jgi:nucleotide-binding universal stress UspA family protein
MLRQLLVPLDGSVLAEMALSQAVTMARVTGSALTLLQVVPWPTQNRSATRGIPQEAELQSRSEEKGQAQAYLWGIEGQLRAAGVSVTSRVREGDPVKAIIAEVTQDPDITLVVMSTHGRSGLGRWFFGSVSEQVLHASRVPLLLVRPEAGNAAGRQPYQDTYGTIVALLDRSPPAEQALDQAATLATAAGATLALVLATPPLPLASMAMYMEATSYQLNVDAWEEESARLATYLAEKADALRARGLRVKTRIAQGNPAEVIRLAVDEVAPDLILMAAHGSGSSGALHDLQELLLGNEALRVAQEARLPVLLIPVRDRFPTQKPADTPAAVAPAPVAPAGVTGNE